jgi:tRNA methyl transferase
VPLFSIHHSLFSSPFNTCEQNDLNAKYRILISDIEVDSPALSKNKDKNTERNGDVRQRGDVLVAMGIDHPKLYHTHLTVNADRMSWVAGQPPRGILDQLAALREQFRRNRDFAYDSISEDSGGCNSGSSCGSSSCSSGSSSSGRRRSSSSCTSSSDSSSAECHDKDGASGGTGDGVLVQIDSSDAAGTKMEVKAFVCEFRARYQQKMGVCSITARLLPADPACPSASQSAYHLKNNISSTTTSKQQELLTGASVDMEFPNELEEVPEDYVLDVVFHEARRAITPGQVLALYLRDECLGGGVIS